MHPKEFKKVKNNTGFFTHRSLVNSELFVGIDFTHHDRINTLMDLYECYILFPSKEAINLSKSALDKTSKKPLAVFLIDSTWSCAKQVFMHSKNLQTLGHLSFDHTISSQYEIKVQPDEYCLSTIESTLVVLKLLKRDAIESLAENQLNSFLDPFLEMVAYQKKMIQTTPSNSVRFRRYQKL